MNKVFLVSLAILALSSLSTSQVVAQNWNDNYSTDKINDNFNRIKVNPNWGKGYSPEEMNERFNRIKTKPIQTPGQIQKPGNIQIPKDIQVIKEPCKQHLLLNSDTLFEFDKSTLTAQAQKTLMGLGGVIKSYGRHPLTVEGHTDSKGNDEYNQGLSERRAQSVKNWLVSHNFIAAVTSVIGYGKRKPIAPNTNTDGSDNPSGRAKNRRVEVVIDTCH